MVDQRWRQVVAYTRGADGDWQREEHLGSGDVRVAALDVTLTLDDIYDDAPLPPLAVGEEDDEELEDSEWT